MIQVNKEKAKKTIEKLFKKTVNKSSKQNSIHLLINSERLDFNMDLAGSSKDNIHIDSEQPYYIASVGKLFTSILVGILYENGKLNFNDNISKFLDDKLLKNLHIYKGKDYSEEIKIKHLLNHTSGLYDHWDPLLENLFENPDVIMSPKKIIAWSKENLKTHCPPGEGFNYSDTNYHLLGLIIEEITATPFHEALKEYIFKPLKMKQSSMLHYSKPIEENKYPMADFYIKNAKLTNYPAYANIDYAGGGIVAPAKDLLEFMKAVVKHQIIQKETFEKMKDWTKYSLGIDYGYGLMNFKTIPLLMPKKYNMWGHAGATGAFMFYHPELDTYLIGTFNDFRFEKKSIRFLFKVINKLYKEI